MRHSYGCWRGKFPAGWHVESNCIIWNVKLSYNIQKNDADCHLILHFLWSFSIFYLTAFDFNVTLPFVFISILIKLISGNSRKLSSNKNHHRLLSAQQQTADRYRCIQQRKRETFPCWWRPKQSQKESEYGCWKSATLVFTFVRWLQHKTDDSWMIPVVISRLSSAVCGHKHPLFLIFLEVNFNTEACNFVPVSTCWYLILSQNFLLPDATTACHQYSRSAVPYLIAPAKQFIS